MQVDQALVVLDSVLDSLVYMGQRGIIHGALSVHTILFREDNKSILIVGWDSAYNVKQLPAGSQPTSDLLAAGTALLVACTTNLSIDEAQTDQTIQPFIAQHPEVATPLYELLQKMCRLNAHERIDVAVAHQQAVALRKRFYS